MVLVAVLSCYSVLAEVTLPKLISNGMVLQRQMPLRIWGYAQPGEQVTVTLGTSVQQATAHAQGGWEVVLPAQAAGGPYVLTVQGTNTIVLHEVYVGDVYVLSGQSNMELPMERLRYKYAAYVQRDSFPAIRQFAVPQEYDFKGKRTELSGGQWVAATSAANIRRFSGVGYFFARHLYEKHRVPIGLLHAAVGGSPAEAWLDEASLLRFPAYHREMQRWKSDSLIKATEATERQAQNAWNAQLNATDQGQKEQWVKPQANLEGWLPIEMPGYFPEGERRAQRGVVWLRKTIEVPATMLNTNAKLELGRIVDADSVFVNGSFVGNITYQYPPRRYELPQGVLRKGKNEIVIRIVSSGDRGGLVPDKPYELTTSRDTISLRGTWHYRWGATMPPAPGSTFVRWKPGGLFNGMIAPLQRYGIAGVLWYQGESNAGRHADYAELMQTLITQWRYGWQQGSFPFLTVQLASFMEAKDQPEESGWAWLRQMQLQTLQVPNTGLVVATDAGEWNDIHPEDKKTIGDRLARWARHMVYGEKNITYSGPLFAKAVVKGSEVRLQFEHVARGLQLSHGTVPKHFAIANEAGTFAWANARVEGNEVVVWHPDIAKPREVRYAWANNPQAANLINSEGLPASPFTTGTLY